MRLRFYPNLVRSVRSVRTAANAVISVWLPPRCLHCGAVLACMDAPAPADIPVQRTLCVSCRMLLAESRLLPYDLPLTVRATPLAAGWMFSDASPVRSLHHAFKYEGRADVAPVLARPLVDVVRRLLPRVWAERRVERPDPQLVCTGVPSHRLRVLDRGYCQAHLLAECLAYGLGVPVRGRLLVRSGPAQTQTVLSASDRWKNVARAFHLDPHARVPPAVILVDDVVTTGATLSGCADVLRAAGCRYLLMAAPGVRPPLPLGGHFQPS